ncbi:permease [Ectobacillus panaciterrae]|uniref:permease n=1 Tax=Ectobacillus panaciterrae TaxID=363872 RepID=UPI00041B6D7F|nr:permease [Ectobacillus panaciterrae]
MLLSRISRDVIGWLLIAMFLFLFFAVDFTNLASLKDAVPSDWRNVTVMFLSIFFEAIPFVLMGVFVSACIQTFISEHTIKKLIPKSPVLAIVPAALVGVIFPMCECVIIPVVRRLMQKGMPLHVGIVILVSAPILNPVVFASTYFAFRTTPHIAYYRMGLAFLVAVLIGIVMYVLFKNQQVLREHEVQDQAEHLHGGRFKRTMYHAADEFFDTGKYLLIGAFAASLFQTFFDRETLTHLASNTALSPLVMMAFGYVLSLCSEADAFIAASFNHAFPARSILAFLVFGPMLDFKNTLMLLAYFKKRFVLSFIFIVIMVVYAVVQIAM